MTYKMYQVTTTHLGTMCIKYQVDKAQREITISSQIFKRLSILIPQQERGLLCLVIFRNKFRKKMVNDSFDKKVILFLSQRDLTTGFIGTLSNLSRNQLNEYLDTWNLALYNKPIGNCTVPFLIIIFIIFIIVINDNWFYFTF